MRPVKSNLLVFATFKHPGFRIPSPHIVWNNFFPKIKNWFSSLLDGTHVSLTVFFERGKSSDCNCLDPKILKFLNNLKGICRQTPSFAQRRESFYHPIRPSCSRSYILSWFEKTFDTIARHIITSITTLKRSGAFTCLLSKSLSGKRHFGQMPSSQISLLLWQ
jgi:hypothetical protein